MGEEVKVPRQQGESSHESQRHLGKEFTEWRRLIVREGYEQAVYRIVLRQRTWEGGMRT